MALFHHWTRSAYQGAMGATMSATLWGSLLPAIGLQHTFALHALLALSALHLAHTSQSAHRAQRLHDAAWHHNKALEGFRGALGNMSDEVVDALFATATINIVYSFGTIKYSCMDIEADNTVASRKEMILGTEWVPIMRGISAVLHPTHVRVSTGPLAPLLRVDDWDAVDPDALSISGDDDLKHLAVAWRGDTQTELYDQALFLLRKSRTYAKIASETHEGHVRDADGDVSVHGAYLGPLVWLHSCPEEFFLKLHQRQPIALLVFAYYGTLLHELRDLWFINSLGRDLVTVVDGMLGNYWAGLMKWPKEVVGISHSDET